MAVQLKNMNQHQTSILGKEVTQQSPSNQDRKPIKAPK